MRIIVGIGLIGMLVSAVMILAGWEHERDLEACKVKGGDHLIGSHEVFCITKDGRILE